MKSPLRLSILIIRPKEGRQGFPGKLRFGSPLLVGALAQLFRQLLGQE